ncbi:MAG: glycerol-3-phosphate 1-O-acyltransferase PlsY [Clostridia bacterium]|nr:glycerol-3-phosphate 1-O-acyltransferase PlsY [Clostridia bacterium]
MAIYIVIAVIAYLIGSISFSVIFTKKFAGFDVRDKGSKNAGSTNVLRTAGKRVAALTLVCDILKGVVAIYIAKAIGHIFDFEHIDYLIQVAALAVVTGHTFPIFFGFKGGKGVATSLGVLFVMNWQIALICLVFALVLMVLTRIVAIGSIAAAILFPILTIFIKENYNEPGNYVVFGIILAVLVCFNHRSNIHRIMNGKENALK